jgi:hypothetical protein
MDKPRHHGHLKPDDEVADKNQNGRSDDSKGHHDLAVCAVVRTFVPPAGDWNDRQRCDVVSAARMLFMAGKLTPAPPAIYYT